MKEIWWKQNLSSTIRTQSDLDDHSAAQVEGEGGVPVAGGVELGSILEGPHVVHLHLVSLQGLAI